MSGRNTVTIASALTRRQAMARATATVVAAPFLIRSGFAQGAVVNIGVIQPSRKGRQHWGRDG
jgi:hypothetical protein